MFHWAVQARRVGSCWAALLLSSTGKQSMLELEAFGDSWHGGAFQHSFVFQLCGQDLSSHCGLFSCYLLFLCRTLVFLSLAIMETNGDLEHFAIVSLLAGCCPGSLGELEVTRFDSIFHSLLFKPFRLDNHFLPLQDKIPEALLPVSSIFLSLLTSELPRNYYPLQDFLFCYLFLWIRGWNVSWKIIL